MHIETLLSLINHIPLFAISTGMWMGIAVSIVIVWILFFYDRLYRQMEEKESKAILHENSRLAMILQTDNTRVWTYSVTTRKYQRLNSEGMPEMEYTPIDFSRFFNHDDFEEMRNEIFSVRDGKKEFITIHMRGPQTTAGTEQRHYEIKITVCKRDADGKPQLLLGVQRDTTRERQQRDHERDELLTYQNVFNTPILDMVFYDENGILTDINDMACRDFGIANKHTIIDSHAHLRQLTYLDDIDIKTLEKTQCTSIIDVKKMEREGRRGAGVEFEGTIYYEMMLYPIRDEQGELLGFFLQGRNITDMVESFQTQRKTMHELLVATNSIKAYIENINMALQTSECRIMNYLPDSHTLQITSDLNMPQYELSQIRALDFIHPENRLTARRLLHQMDHRSLRNIHEQLETIFPSGEGSNIWLTLNGIPMYDKDGNITHYFGMSRNDTKLITTQLHLKAETQKAQEAEALKNMFLLNMSYEIRTPLSTVIGFAELFDHEHNPADEPIFVEEIKKSSDSLLTLVNDILYLSRIDAHMVEVNKQPNDFAVLFDAHCHMGWSSNSNPRIKTIIENPYEHLLLNIDEQLLGQVIEQLIQNSVFYTHEGIIRAKYEYRSQALNITIEDTGGGISKDIMPHLFDRFTDKQSRHLGSGLTLPIIKGLIELMGGTIEVTSEVGTGTTIWVTIPCELYSREMKTLKVED